MRHYLSHDTDGKLVGIHTHHHAGTMLGGWPDDCQLHNPACQNPTSKHFRENVVGKNGVVGLIPFDCHCSPTKTSCSCASHAFANKKVVDGALVNKLEGALLNGSSILKNKATVKAAPGSKLTMKVVCVGVADGSSIEVYQKGTVVLMETSPVALVFTKGETPTFEVTAPAQGLSGALVLFSRDVVPILVGVVGWA